jgi:predicted alpha/beta hydrolase family esterase
MKPVDVLILPGWQNSGPAHWQTRWEAVYGYERLEQHDWMRPLRGDWIARLEEALLLRAEPVLLVAHSLGCLLVPAWAECSRNVHRVKAALLVAPGDAEREELRPTLATWAPVPAKRLPFSTILVGSQNDPFCTDLRARQFANAWGSEYVDYGYAGHINADSNLGDWPAGHQMLDRCNQLGTNLKVRPETNRQGT